MSGADARGGGDMVMADKDDFLVYFGTYTDGDSEGIYLSRLDAASGRMGPVSLAAEVDSPNFLALHPTGRFLYAVSGIGEDPPPVGSVYSFAIDPSTGALDHLNRQPSGGEGPCHLDVDGAGRYLLAANYLGGSVAALPIREDGSLGEPTDTRRHSGVGVHPERQDGPHPHSINLDPADRFAYVPDLGVDKVYVYELDDAGTLRPAEPPWVELQAGAGPRHLDFHPNGRYAYLINELDSTVSAFALGAGRLDSLQTVSTLPDDFDGTNYTADIHVAGSGRFLYGSNRGHDSIAIFAVDEDTGELTYLDREPTRGQFPRNFTIDPSGSLMLVANQDSGTVLTFRVDRQDGTLEHTGDVAEVPYPVCVQLVPSP